MDNRTIARTLGEIADLLEIKGENAFRVRSYRVGAEAFVNLGEEAGDLLRAGKDLRSIPGVGDGIAKKVKEMVESGALAYHRELQAEVPAGLLELLQLPGLGPKGVQLVWMKLGVKGPADLEAAIRDGRFRTLPGMKEKKEARILKGLLERATARSRFLVSEAAAAVRMLSAFLVEKGASAVTPAGSFRRGRETVGDVDLIVEGGDPLALADAFAAHPEVTEVLVHGEAKTSVRLRTGLQVDLRPFAPESLGAALQYFTGSKEHNVKLRERALKRGLKLNEYGVYRLEDGARVAGATEEEVYAALGLAWVPPALREDRGEIAAAEAGRLPSLVERRHLRGDLHVHVDDGALDPVVAAARAAGLQFVALVGPVGAGAPAALDHLARVRALKTRGLRVIAALEADIGPDGGLDLPDAVLAKADLVIAALHSHLEGSREEMTARILRGLAHPRVRIWGHPTGRRLLEREGAAFDLDPILEAAARTGIALEINGEPARLDLPDTLVRAARDKGARFVISSGAHAPDGLADLEFAIGQARRGWLGPDAVLNTRPDKELAEFVAGGR